MRGRNLKTVKLRSPCSTFFLIKKIKTRLKIADSSKYSKSTFQFRHRAITLQCVKEVIYLLKLDIMQMQYLCAFISTVNIWSTLTGLLTNFYQLILPGT